MVYPSLFLYFFHRLVFPCSYVIGGTIPTSVLVLVKTIFTIIIIYTELLLLDIRNVQTHASYLNHAAIYEFERWVLTTKEYAKSVNIHSVNWWCIWKGTCIMWRRNKKGICGSCLAANRSSLCAAVWLELHFLCPVAVRIRPKSPSAISIERATPQTPPNSRQCTKGRHGLA